MPRKDVGELWEECRGEEMRKGRKRERETKIFA
jgi:hypothetical protein